MLSLTTDSDKLQRCLKPIFWSQISWRCSAPKGKYNFTISLKKKKKLKSLQKLEKMSVRGKYEVSLCLRSHNALKAVVGDKGLLVPTQMLPVCSDHKCLFLFLFFLPSLFLFTNVRLWSKSVKSFCWPIASLIHTACKLELNFQH